MWHHEHRHTHAHIHAHEHTSWMTMDVASRTQAHTRTHTRTRTHKLDERDVSLKPTRKYQGNISPPTTHQQGAVQQDNTNTRHKKTSPFTLRAAWMHEPFPTQRTRTHTQWTRTHAHTHTRTHTHIHTHGHTRRADTGITPTFLSCSSFLACFSFFSFTSFSFFSLPSSMRVRLNKHGEQEEHRLSCSVFEKSRRLVSKNH